MDEAIVLPLLGAALADEALRSHAIEVLAGRGGPDAMADLRQAFRAPDPHLRMMVVEMTAPDGQGLQWPQEARSDPDTRVRALAASRLQQIGSERAD